MERRTKKILNSWITQIHLCSTQDGLFSYFQLIWQSIHAIYIRSVAPFEKEFCELKKQTRRHVIIPLNSVPHVIWKKRITVESSFEYKDIHILLVSISNKLLLSILNEFKLNSFKITYWNFFIECRILQKFGMMRRIFNRSWCNLPWEVGH